MSVQFASAAPHPANAVIEKGELKDFIDCSGHSEKKLILRGDTAVITSGLLEVNIIQLFLRGSNEKYLVSLENFQNSSAKFLGDEITLELDSNSCYAKFASELGTCDLEFRNLTCHYSGEEELDLGNIEKIVKELKVKNLRLVLKDSQAIEIHFDNCPSFSILDSLTLFGGSVNLDLIKALRVNQVVINRPSDQITSADCNSYLKSPTAKQLNISFQKPMIIDESELLMDLKTENLSTSDGKRVFLVKSGGHHLLVSYGKHKFVAEQLEGKTAEDIAEKAKARMEEFLQ